MIRPGGRRAWPPGGFSPGGAGGAAGGADPGTCHPGTNGHNATFLAGGGGGGGASFGPAGSVFAAATTGPRVVISYTVPEPAMTIDKIAEPATFSAAGDVIRNIDQAIKPG